MKNFYNLSALASPVKKGGVILFMLGLALTAKAQYTLTEADVELDQDGYITSCSYDFTEKELIIPAAIGEQAVLGIADSYGAWGAIFADKGLTSITLPEGMVHLGDYAFYNNALTSLVVPEGVTYIGKSAFQNNSIVDLELPSTLKVIESAAFYFCDVASLELPEGLEQIKSNAFGANDFTSLILPASLKLIEANALGSGIDKLVLPESLTGAYSQWANSIGGLFAAGEEIDYNSSADYWPILTYTLTDDDVTVEEGVITACSADLEGFVVTIPNVLEEQSISGISGGTIVDGVRIGPFVDKGIKGVVLPAGLKRIEDYTFFSNTLSEVVIPSGVEFIGQAAFAMNQLTEVQFQGESQLLFITWSAFNDNYGLSLSFPEVSRDGFAGWQDSNGVLYQAGDELVDKQLNYAAKVPYVITDEDVVVENGFIQSTSYNSNYKFIIIPDELDGQAVKGIKALTENGIFSHKGMYELTLPTTLEELCFAAFAWNNLSEIDLSRCVNLSSIDEYAFYSNKLNSLVVPATVAEIGYEAFASNRLTEVGFEEPAQVALMGASAFNANSEDLELVFPTPVKEGFEFKYWINWSDETFEGGALVPDLKREYEAVFSKIPTSLDEQMADALEWTLVGNQLVIESPESLVLKLYNMSGQLVYESAVPSGAQTIDLDFVAAGTFVLKAKGENGWMRTKKIIMQ